MKVFPIRRDRMTAGLRWRVRRLGRRLAGPPTVTLRPPVEGVVEEFSTKQLSGWIAVKDGASPVRVRLMLNDLEVSAAWATTARPDRTATDGEARRFDLRLHDVWAYAGTSDTLRVLADDRPLPIVGHGTWLSPERSGKHTPATLRAKLSSGHIFGQTGRLQLSKKLDLSWQAAAIGLYGEVRAIVAEALGYDVFLFYGSLLGAVREGTVIGHDVDFDAAYVTTQTNPRAAALELMELGLLLVDRGYHVRCAYTSLHIYSRDGSGNRIDLFHTYFNDRGLLCLPFGQAGTIDVPHSDWRGTKEIDFCGGRALVPANDEQMAELLYGSGWRSPQPGFDWARECTKRDWPGVLSVADVQEVYWADLYSHHEFTDASTFFAKVSSMPDLPSTVVDLGCGDGRDSLAFASTGRAVLGVDGSSVAVRNAARRAAEQGLEHRVRFVVCDLGYVDRLSAEVGKAVEAGDGNVLFYLRFVLHAVPAKTQALVLQVLSELARPGDLLAAEFRTEEDENRPKTFGSRYRRFQNGPAFGRDLTEKYGFTVVDEEAGTGLAPYKREDPALYRVVARKA